MNEDDLRLDLEHPRGLLVEEGAVLATPPAVAGRGHVRRLGRDRDGHLLGNAADHVRFAVAGEILEIPHAPRITSEKSPAPSHGIPIEDAPFGQGLGFGVWRPPVHRARDHGQRLAFPMKEDLRVVFRVKIAIKHIEVLLLLHPHDDLRVLCVILDPVVTPLAERAQPPENLRLGPVGQVDVDEIDAQFLYKVHLVIDEGRVGAAVGQRPAVLGNIAVGVGGPAPKPPAGAGRVGALAHDPRDVHVVPYGQEKPDHGLALRHDDEGPGEFNFRRRSRTYQTAPMRKIQLKR